ncbi:NAD(P)-dependent alcohol dehydrogenase [Rhizobium daejeonense]
MTGSSPTEPGIPVSSATGMPFVAGELLFSSTTRWRLSMIAKGYAASEVGGSMIGWTFDRRKPRPEDVEIDILYCGVCHSDLHHARNDWQNTVYPVVPGQEIIGRVLAVGGSVRKFRPGDIVAVGPIVDACLECAHCAAGEEQYCLNRPTLTYNSRDRVSGEVTYGGYSTGIVVSEEFVIRLPQGLAVNRAAPLLCAGIAGWSPLRRWEIGAGSRVGIVGLGGVGHIAVKLAVALGAQVTVITSSPTKIEDARKLGATNVVLISDEQAMADASGHLDYILDTIPVPHDLSIYLDLLSLEGSLVIIGSLGSHGTIRPESLLRGRKQISVSIVGGIAETIELLKFCAERQILPDTETIAMQDINMAFARMEHRDIKYRFVIDMATLKAEIA